MSDIIHLLPDSVANQIAAGEVIQRPASVIKELVENAIDAGATEIKVVVKDAGRTLIQVIDNGKGMSETDARMAFERHATSKIKSAHDLFSLTTMGFRGEALASIAAVAQVELRTKKAEDELGTIIEISGSRIEKQEAISCSNGSSFSIKNLFFNIPARRKFLKAPKTELNHIITEFNRIALIYPHIAFLLNHDNEDIYHLEEGSLRQRIVSVFGKNMNAQLVPINTETSMVNISGFIGKPEVAKKSNFNQYFFVNGRYMRHPYFHKAIMHAYEKMLVADSSPSYFISFDIDPSSIDVNIHPTKTEIKFENEQAIWSILSASVKEALGKFNIVPGIDFDTENALEMPLMHKDTKIVAPQVSFNTDYNPFNTHSENSNSGKSSYKRESIDWEKLYEGFEKDNGSNEQPTSIGLDFDEVVPEVNDSRPQVSETCSDFIQICGKYLVSPAKSGMMVIHQQRAHVRILFEQNLFSIQQRKGISQQLLFPELIELTQEDSLIIEELIGDLAYVGFDIDCFGKNTYRINGIPSGIEGKNPVSIIEEMISASRNQTQSGKDKLHEHIALTMAQSMSMNIGTKLSKEEINSLISKLFNCEIHNYSPDGKKIINIINLEDIDKQF